jgi:DNA-binding NtrC family response regulator
MSSGAPHVDVVPVTQSAGHSDAAGLAPHAPAVQLRVLRGAQAGGFCLLDAKPLVIGSALTSGLVINDRFVSRAHCEVSLREGQCFVRDLGSSNGTFVNGARVTEALVGLQAQIRIGNTELGVVVVPQEAEEAGRFGEMVGRSSAARRMFAALRNIAKSSLGCLLLGDTGTGKELAAKALHDHSGRAGKPFLVVDCAAVGAQFIEDKLFGHDRGAFTGATSAVPGVFEQARGGTVFLDEIGELPLPLQAKLLGVLERREATRIGSHTPIKLDVRLISATHRNLASMTANNEFRQDLLYRISEFTQRIPSLRERREDIPLIAREILEREGHGRMLSPDALEYLQEQPWPGNVRELRNLIRRADALADNALIQRDMLESLEEVTAQISIPDALLAPARVSALPVATRSLHPGWSRAPAAAVAADSGPPPAPPRDFDLPLAEATESFRSAYVRELRKRYGDDLNAAGAHAGVHPKSVSRLYRLYRND